MIFAEVDDMDSGVKLEQVKVGKEEIQKITAEARLIPFVKIKPVCQVSQRGRLDDNFH